MYFVFNSQYNTKLKQNRLQTIEMQAEFTFNPPGRIPLFKCASNTCSHGQGRDTARLSWLQSTVKIFLDKEANIACTFVVTKSHHLKLEWYFVGRAIPLFNLTQ